jgi:glycosyltransferase involved in cell wall biosynthesis
VITRHRVVMVATSYPRFPGDTVGTFMEPIAHGLAARGHDVHMVLPWHPRWTRPLREDGVAFHLFRYAPAAALNVFGYAGALHADVSVRGAAMLAAPLALTAGWRTARLVARRVGATMMHGHWVVPGGAMAAAAAGDLPLVISLHGSDVYLAERHGVIGRAARWAFSRASMVTACSEDLRVRAEALGAPRDTSVTIPYGVDVARFRPDAAVRAATRARWQLGADAEVVFSAGRFVRKKGFEHLIDAFARLAPSRPALRLVLAGGGDLDPAIRHRLSALAVADRALLPGILTQDDVAAGLAAADVAVVPSVHDEAGNVDGLPNVVMEALASATPLVATRVGGIASVVQDGVTGLLVPERDAAALASAINRCLDDRAFGQRLGVSARRWAATEATWERAAEAFEDAYARAVRSRGARS